MVAATANVGRSTSLDQRPTKKSRACTNCHSRKVRCNAWEVGTPCTRCKRRKQSNTCVLLEPLQRNASSPIKAQRRLQRQRTNLTEAFSSRDEDSTIFTFADEHVFANDDEQTRDAEVHQLLPSPDHTRTDRQLEATRRGEEPPIREEDAQVRIFQEMSRSGHSVVSPASDAQAHDRREVYEYHEGVNPMTIVGEALGQKGTNRLIRISVLNDASTFDCRRSFPGLDEVDIEYLHKKGALDYPPRRICDALLRLYFECIYPYAPVLDRISFMQDYSDNKSSPFLIQSVFANTVPFAPLELLHQMGFQDRLTAQKSLHDKAKLLYDIGCEKSQLRLLQGSVMLGSLYFAYATDKDYRYWLTNASRIAGQIGLHRKCVSEGLEPTSRRLFRRIWWVLYNRDVLLAISGTDNQRRFSDRYCDTSPLTEADWEEDVQIPERFHHILSPVLSVHKTFLIQYSKLSTLSSLFLRDFKRPGKIPSTEEIDIVSNQIRTWKGQLPIEMQPTRVQEWSVDNIWILILLAMGYRLEAVFCRSAKQHCRATDDIATARRFGLWQENAMLEHSTIIQRASTNEILHLFPLSFMICASTILAMRIELALQPSKSARQLLANKAQILSELEIIREASRNWSSLVWTVRMFEAVLDRTGLGLKSITQLDPNETYIDDPPRNGPEDFTTYDEDTSLDETNAGYDRTPRNGNLRPFVNTTDQDELYGLPPMPEDYDWLQSLLTPRPINDILIQLDDMG